MTILDRISADLGLTSAYVLTLAKSASHRYKHFQVPKRSGGVRDIFHPSRELKALQYWISVRLVEGLPVSDAAYGYRKGRSTKMHAQVHQGARFTLRMDIQDFFPSINDEDFRNYVLRNPGVFQDWKEPDLRLVCQLAFRNHSLPIGAPSSPSISNALMRGLDEQILGASRDLGIRYSRYADDLVFSSMERDLLGRAERQVTALVEACDIPGALRINKLKTRHASKKRRQSVTGVVLTSDGEISVGRPLKRIVRSLVHKADLLDPASQERLAGLLGYIRSVEPAFLNRLVLKYGPERLERVQKHSRPS